MVLPNKKQHKPRGAITRTTITTKHIDTTDPVALILDEDDEDQRAGKLAKPPPEDKAA